MSDTNEPQLKPREARRGFDNLMKDESGIAFTEYVVLTSVVTITGAGAIFLLGLPMVRMYEWGSALVTIPIP